MSKTEILTKNLSLTSKLLEFLANNPDATKNYPSGISYIVFSFKDKNLNKQNEKMLQKLKSDGKKIVKATNRPGSTSWKLEPLF